MKASNSRERKITLRAVGTHFGTDYLVLALRPRRSPTTFGSWLSLKRGGRAVSATVLGQWVTIDDTKPYGLPLSRILELVETGDLALEEMAPTCTLSGKST